MNSIIDIFDIKKYEYLNFFIMVVNMMFNMLVNIVVSMVLTSARSVYIIKFTLAPAGLRD